MDKQAILLAKTLEAANVPIDPETFLARMTTQYIVYLLQAAGLHLGYSHRWCGFGPFSSQLLDHLFELDRIYHSEREFPDRHEILQQQRRELDSWSFDPASKEKARGLRPLLHRSGETPDETAIRLRVLASILFLINTNQAPLDDRQQLAEVLRRTGLEVSMPELSVALEELRLYGLLQPSQQQSQ